MQIHLYAFHASLPGFDASDAEHLPRLATIPLRNSAAGPQEDDIPYMVN